MEPSITMILFARVHAAPMLAARARARARASSGGASGRGAEGSRWAVAPASRMETLLTIKQQTVQAASTAAARRKLLRV